MTYFILLTSLFKVISTSKILTRQFDVEFENSVPFTVILQTVI